MTLSQRTSIYNFKTSGMKNYDGKLGGESKPTSLQKKLENMINNLSSLNQMINMPSLGNTKNTIANERNFLLTSK